MLASLSKVSTSRPVSSSMTVKLGSHAGMPRKWSER